MNVQMKNAKRAALVAIMVLLTLGGPATTAQAQTYPAVATITVDRTTVPNCGNGVVVVSGTGFLPNTTVTISVGGQVLGTTTTDANGNFSFSYTVPAGYTLGPLTFTATDGTNTLSVTTTVIGCATSNNGNAGSTNAGSGSNAGTTSGSLASTGSAYTVLLVRIAVLLIAAGGIALLAINRRQRRSARPA